MKILKVSILSLAFISNINLFSADFDMKSNLELVDQLIGDFSLESGNPLHQADSDFKLNSENLIITKDQIRPYLYSALKIDNPQNPKEKVNILIPDLNEIILNYADPYFINEYNRINEELSDINISQENLCKIFDEIKVLKEKLLKKEINDGRHTSLIEDFIKIEARTIAKSFIPNDLDIYLKGFIHSQLLTDTLGNYYTNSSINTFNYILNILHSSFETNKYKPVQLNDDRCMTSRINCLIWYLIIKNDAENYEHLIKAIKIKEKISVVNEYQRNNPGDIDKVALDKYLEEQMEIRALNFKNLIEQYRKLYQLGIREIIAAKL